MTRLMHLWLGRALLLAALALLAALGGGAQAAPPSAAGAAPALVAATYLGGGGADRSHSVGRDAEGNIYVVGETYSSIMMGRAINNRGGCDIFVAKLSPDARQLLGLFTVGSARDDNVGAAAVTPAGEVVVAVNTNGDDFPLKGALSDTIEPKNPGALLKVNAALDGLVFSTYTDFTVAPELHTIGVDGEGAITVAGFVYTASGPRRDLSLERFSPDGQRQLMRKVWDDDNEFEQPQGLVVQPDGTAFIAGYVTGRWGGLAVTDNAFQKECGRRLALGADWDCDNDAFVMRVTPDGTVDYASYLGGNGSDKAVGIGVDAQGAMVILGDAGASDFPTTAGAHQPRCRVAKPGDSCYYDMFVAKLAPDGSALVYSTYLASGDESGLDYPGAIAVDAAGNATVTGTTASELWPVQDALQSALAAAPCPNAFQDRLCFDAVVATLSPSGELSFSSYLGGKGDEYGNDVAIGPDGSIFLAGTSESADFPATPGSAQPAPRSNDEAFLAHIGAAPPTGNGTNRVYLPLVHR